MRLLFTSASLLNTTSLKLERPILNRSFEVVEPGKSYKSFICLFDLVKLMKRETNKYKFFFLCFSTTTLTYPVKHVSRQLLIFISGRQEKTTLPFLWSVVPIFGPTCTLWFIYLFVLQHSSRKEVKVDGRHTKPVKPGTLFVSQGAWIKHGKGIPVNVIKYHFVTINV